MRRLIAIVALFLALLLCGPAHATITPVQSPSNTGTSGTTVTVTTSATSASNLLIAVVTVRKNASMPGVTMTGFTRDVHITDSGSLFRIAVFHRTGDGGTSYAASFDAAPRSSQVTIYEYSGMDLSSPFDQTAQNEGSGTTPSTGTTGTTAQADELCVSGIVNASTGATFSSPTNSFVETAGTENSQGQASHVGHTRIVSSTGTYSHAATSTGNSSWFGAVATYKAASTAATTPPSTLAMMGVGL